MEARVRLSQFVAGLAIVAMAVPMWARPRTDSADLVLTQSAVVGGARLQPGNYEISVEEQGNQLRVVREGKLVAEVPCHWIQLRNKAQNTEVLFSSKNQITEVDFGGRTEAIQIQQPSR